MGTDGPFTTRDGEGIGQSSHQCEDKQGVQLRAAAQGYGICEPAEEAAVPERFASPKPCLLILPLGGRAEKKAHVSPLLHSPGHREQGVSKILAFKSVSVSVQEPKIYFFHSFSGNIYLST